VAAAAVLAKESSPPTGPNANEASPLVKELRELERLVCSIDLTIRGVPEEGLLGVSFGSALLNLGLYDEVESFDASRNIKKIAQIFFCVSPISSDDSTL
jgi:hypothetical protein